jgi:hypothetical protein
MERPMVTSRQMTDHDVKVAGDIGEMKADVRTIKHDLVNIQQSMLGLNEKLNSLTNQQSRGLGFFAGAAMIITVFGGFLLAAVKLLFGGLVAGGKL